LLVLFDDFFSLPFKKKKKRKKKGKKSVANKKKNENGTLLRVLQFDPSCDAIAICRFCPPCDWH